VRYPLKTPYRDGTTHVLFEPVDFIARLAALVPKPRVNLTHPPPRGVRPEQPRPRTGHPGPARAATPVEGAPDRGRASSSCGPSRFLLPIRFGPTCFIVTMARAPPKAAPGATSCADFSFGAHWALPPRWAKASRFPGAFHLR
jgi:hypothetical protein